MKSTNDGFTLIEVCIAILIASLALYALNQSSINILTITKKQELTTLNRICISNIVTELRISPKIPEVGELKRECKQQNYTFNITLQTFTTPNPSFRRIVIISKESDQEIDRYTTVIGRS